MHALLHFPLSATSVLSYLVNSPPSLGLLQVLLSLMFISVKSVTFFYTCPLIKAARGVTFFNVGASLLMTLVFKVLLSFHPAPSLVFLEVLLSLMFGGSLVLKLLLFTWPLIIRLT